MIFASSCCLFMGCLIRSMNLHLKCLGHPRLLLHLIAGLAIFAKLLFRLLRKIHDMLYIYCRRVLLAEILSGTSLTVNGSTCVVFIANLAASVIHIATLTSQMVHPCCWVLAMPRLGHQLPAVRAGALNDVSERASDEKNLILPFSRRLGPVDGILGLQMLLLQVL